MDLKKLYDKMNKGVAGLDILLQVVAFLFAIGLVVMIFMVMGQNLQDNASIVGTEAADSINATKIAIGDATDFFDIMILISSMVVLVLLTVIIIRSVRSGAFTGRGGA